MVENCDCPKPGQSPKEASAKMASKTGEATKKLGQMSNNAKNLLGKASLLIEKSSGIKQLLLGTTTGWCTGFLMTRVGKVAAISVGSSIVLMAAASQTGLVNINWNKLGSKLGTASGKVEQSIVKNAPKIQANVGKYARTNSYFVAGFVGGMLLGICS